MTDYEQATTAELSEAMELYSTTSLDVLLNNPSVLDDLSRCLDKELKVISYWLHLAYELKIPADVYRRFEGYTDFSPTIRMFDYLQATRPKLTVGDLNAALTRIYRMDLIKLVSKSGFGLHEKVVDLFAKDEKRLDTISMELDNNKHMFGSWRQFGRELKIPRDTLERFEMCSSQSPTRMLFKFLKSRYPGCTVRELKTHLSKMKRNDVLETLDKFSVKDSSLLVDSIRPDSDILDEMEKQLNRNIPDVGNWRVLARRFNIPHEIYDDFEPRQSGQRSPTKLMLEWLARAREGITIRDVINGLEKIERNDAIEILTDQYKSVIGNQCSSLRSDPTAEIDQYETPPIECSSSPVPCKESTVHLPPDAVSATTNQKTANPVTEHCDIVDSNQPITTMLLCDEWGSSKGGLSTFNRLLAKQLARNPNIKVHCHLLEACESDKKDAAEKLVNIIIAEPVPGTPNSYMKLYLLPQELHDPDIVISHGRQFGPVAHVIHKQRPNCKWVHFLHVNCEEIGKYKDNPRAISDNNQKDEYEVDLCKEADLVVAVGPLLEQKYKIDLSAAGKEVLGFIPGLSEEFLDLTQSNEERKQFRVYIFGRASSEDFHLKGYDVAANAVALLDKTYQLFSVGAGDADQVRQRFLDETNIRDDQLTVHEFCKDRSKLREMMCKADVVVMPSRAEAFGLIGLEAISAGVPVLVSGKSGLGMVLENLESGHTCVVESDDPNEWAVKIETCGGKVRSKRNEEARVIREQYREAHCWDRECKILYSWFSRLVGRDSATNGTAAAPLIATS